MSLNDAKIRSLKPTDKPFKVSDSTVCICWSNQAVPVSGILNTVLMAKNPVLHWVPTLPSPCLTPASSAKASVRCWR